MLVFLFLSLLLGKNPPPTTTAQFQPSRPVVLPEARPIRATPLGGIESPIVVLPATSQTEGARNLSFGITPPKRNRQRISFPAGDFPSLVIVQTDGERQAFTKEELQRWIETQGSIVAPIQPGIFVENGAVYINTGGITIPLSSGGASGCFGVSPERNEQIQKEVRLQLEAEKKK